jgi:glucokinase
VTSAVGVDLGGTKVLTVLVDGDEVVAEAKANTPTGGPDAVVAAIVECVERLGADRTHAVGIGAPGVVDVAAGTVGSAPNLVGFDQPVPLAAMVAERLRTDRVLLDNDANVGTLAEHRLGAGRTSRDLLGVFVGTGVGGGLVLDGDLRHGPGGLAGEIGHVVVEEGGRLCGCGRLGHLEAYAGRSGIEREARARHAAGRSTALVDLAGSGRMKSSVIAKALAAGDEVALELLDRAVASLGAALASAVAFVDVDLVVMGGGLADRLGAAFVGRVEQATRERLFVPTGPVRVVPAALGERAGAIGASLLVRDR